MYKERYAIPGIPVRALVAVLVCALTLTACDDDDLVVDPDDDDDDPEVFVWDTALEGLEGWEQLSGDAEVTWEEESTQFSAEASIAGDEPDAVRPWHVHDGTCGSGGPIVGEDGDYPRLEVDENGDATASVTVSQALDPTADYHVNVHLADDELETIIACGDLVVDGAGLQEDDDDDGDGY